MPKTIVALAPRTKKVPRTVYVVILQSGKETTVSTFDGKDSLKQAMTFAEQKALGGEYLATVTQRLRTLGDYGKFGHLIV